MATCDRNYRQSIGSLAIVVLTIVLPATQAFAGEVTTTVEVTSDTLLQLKNAVQQNWMTASRQTKIRPHSCRV